ncbi:hypothetical protein GBAR_LOCUS16924 [Geodia barretti]|uniref:Uncharacterized protein n=1 Tax=Geodia barretti TaxID=519541 RepID=A0AA35SGZ9_GEOBA|nr:hypothetical protein GBAR_LOCUS16924 [Geodia barretti]
MTYHWWSVSRCNNQDHTMYLVSEILMDGSEGYNTLELPDITIALASATDNTSKKENGTPTVTGLSAVLGLTLLGLLLAILLAFIFFLKRRSTTKRKNNGE